MDDHNSALKTPSGAYRALCEGGRSAAAGPFAAPASSRVTRQVSKPPIPTSGIDIDQVTQQLEGEGVEKFNQGFDKLMNALRAQSSQP